MKLRISHIILMMLLTIVTAYGQISPGDLSSSHEKLEGMSNCTLCHDIGKKVSNQKCLDCHKEIQSLLNQDRGYHANSTVVRKDCFECHSDHHGRKFDMVRFDEKNLDHDLTGYELEGKHDIIDCRDCHVSENISDPEIRRRKDTFLGLDQECLSCHDDFHQQTLSSDCMACHTMDGFVPASKFDHNESEYPLKGKHIEVDCIECHKETTRNGKEFKQFSDLSFTDCSSCHTDPHKKQLQGTCTQCHVESSFTDFRGKGNFNHNTTQFKLKDAHRAVDCFSCHERSSDPTAVFQDNLKVEETDCIACHTDTHEGKFGTDCAKCHNESSFLALNNMDFFDHTITDYPLEGKHVGVQCAECHIERFSTEIDFSECKNCHTDYHNGEFVENNSSPDCVECHSLEFGFDYSLYTVEKHQTNEFPLEGAHVATPCFACHISEDDERWTFANIGEACVDCHTNIHESFISEKYYPEDSCLSCHTNEAWSLVSFDHDLTEWPLDGKHREVSCKECHFEMSENKSIISQNFINLGTDCASCHENIHEDAFAENGVTDCNRCHVTDSWFPKKFDHNKTSFRLEGAHSEISCSACHEVDAGNGEKEILYKLNKLECVDCHI